MSIDEIEESNWIMLHDNTVKMSLLFLATMIVSRNVTVSSFYHCFNMTTISKKMVQRKTSPVSILMDILTLWIDRQTRKSIGAASSIPRTAVTLVFIPVF